MFGNVGLLFYILNEIVMKLGERSSSKYLNMPRNSRIDAPGALVLASGKDIRIVQACILLSFWTTSELGFSQTWLWQKLKISQPAVSLSIKRGKE